MNLHWTPPLLSPAQPRLDPFVTPPSTCQVTLREPPADAAPGSPAAAQSRMRGDLPPFESAPHSSHGCVVSAPTPGQQEGSSEATRHNHGPPTPGHALAKRSRERRADSTGVLRRLWRHCWCGRGLGRGVSPGKRPRLGRRRAGHSDIMAETCRLPGWQLPETLAKGSLTPEAVGFAPLPQLRS